jgi:hypothetical protein
MKPSVLDKPSFLDKPSLLDRGWNWVSSLPLATLITLLGLFFFSGQAARYDSFYSPLSVNLEDIGLSYSTILARSGERIITPLFLILLSYYMLRRAQEAAKEGEWRAGRAYTGRWRWLRASRAWSRPFWFILLGFVAMGALAVYEVELITTQEDRIKASVSAVREGRAITEIKTTTSGFTILNVHVHKARIEPVTAANVPPVVTDLRGSW